MRNIISHFKSLNSDISEYIDLSIYKSSNIFRLPQKSNKKESYGHQVITGEMINYMIHYIPSDSIEYIFSNLCRYNILRNKKNKIIIPTVLKNTNEIIQQNMIKPYSMEIPDVEYQAFYNSSQFRNDDRTEWVNLGCLLYSLYDTNGSENYLLSYLKKYKILKR